VNRHGTMPAGLGDRLAGLDFCLNVGAHFSLTF
jgi:hypothetical protein